MTESNPTTAPTAMEPGPPRQTAYSQDYWDVVLSQIRRRRTSTAALYVLIALYSIAVFAPFLANDRPIMFKGVDLVTYRSSLRELGVATRSAADLFENGKVAYESTVAGRGAAQSWDDAIERNVTAVVTRVDRMRQQLSDDDGAPLDEMLETLSRLAAGAAKGEVVTSEEATSLVTAATHIQSTMKPVSRASEVVANRTVRLQPYTSFPVLANLSRSEVFFMTLFLMILGFPLWNRLVNNVLLGRDRFRVRRARTRKGLAFLLLPLLAAVLWQGTPGEFFVSTFKSGLTSGDVVAELVTFPIIPYGIAESNPGEDFRPPSWHPTAEITEEGYYVRGGREGRFDPDTGTPLISQPVKVEFGEPARNHFWRHPLGADSLGRDLLARLIWGARVSLAVGFVATIIQVVIGIIMGALAGYYGRWVDLIISRFIEIVQTFPVFFLILIMVAFVGPSIINIMVIIGLVSWTGIARLVRGEFIRLRGEDFVVASEALGVPNIRTMFRHVLPNALGPVMVAATFGVASGILTESALSFLGVGIQLPLPSWGALLIESRSADHWWIQIFPGLLIFLTVLLYNLFGEGVRDALDPRLKVNR